MMDSSETCSGRSTRYGISRAQVLLPEAFMSTCAPAATSLNSSRSTNASTTCNVRGGCTHAKSTYLMSNELHNIVRDHRPQWGSCSQQEGRESLILCRPWILPPLIILFLLVSDISVKAVDAYQGSSSSNQRWSSSERPGGRFLAESTNSAFTVVSVDQILQQAAFSAIADQNLAEYIPHVVSVPANLSGVTALAVRLVRHSILSRGVKLNEFQIPIGSVILARVKRLIVVYQNFGNFTSKLFQPPPGQDFLSPVLSVAVYDASNITSVNPVEYSVSAVASSQAITVTFAGVSSPFAAGTSPLCASFSSSTGNATSTGTAATGTGPYVCNITQLGAVALVGQAVAAPAPAPGSKAAVAAAAPSKKHSNAWKIAVGVVVGVIGGVILLSLLGILAYRYREKRRFDQMHRNSDLGETLQQSSVGQSRAPVAGSTRTRPTLEKFE